jgi:hypothetical protein
MFTVTMMFAVLSCDELIPVLEIEYLMVASVSVSSIDSPLFLVFLDLVVERCHPHFFRI